MGALKLHFISLRYDVLLLYQPPSRTQWVLSALRYLTPIWKPKLVLVDIVFAKIHSSLFAGPKALIKALLWRQVDLFISFMKDVRPLRDHFRIAPEKCRYVPFKINPFGRQHLDDSWPEGNYVFTGGKSRRDFTTFCHAMRALGLPGVIVTPQGAEAATHETFLDLAVVPANVRVVHDDGTQESWLRWVGGSKLVVLCITDDSISPSGVGAYLLAMGLGKCVIITDCPATRDILEDGNEAIIVPQHNVHALTAAIKRAWEDDAWRRAIAESGKRYARSLGGERELVQRFVDAVIGHFSGSSDEGVPCSVVID